MSNIIIEIMIINNRSNNLNKKKYKSNNKIKSSFKKRSFIQQMNIKSIQIHT